MRKESVRAVSSALVLSMAGLGNAQAGIDKIYGTTVEQGELELEMRGVHVLDDEGGSEGDKTLKFAVGYGVNAWWWTEAYLEFEDERGEDAELEAYELENIFQLSEPGEYAVDFGFLTEIEKVRELDIVELKVGPLFQKDFADWTGKLNLLTERQFGDDKTEDEWEFIGRAQLKYRLSSAFEPGIELHTEEHSKALGIVGMGTTSMSETPVEWLFGLFSGMNDDTPDLQARWELEFEF
ncbi:MAG TPA: hypothetical protein VFX02_02815 [Gammaproteobacteria bacterium]|nr:hypothetical protein [Gammaproteobacteria bacterium]